MLTVQHLEKEYPGVDVFKDVSFSIGKGQKIALIGNNGSGKSTLLRILSGDESPDRGTIRYNPGVRVAYVPQDVSVHENRSLSDFLHDSFPTTQDEFFPEAQLNTLLVAFGFSTERRKKSLSEMSGGEKKKTELIRALIQNTDILLLDEPTNNLDLPSIIALEQIILSSSATIIVASHDRRFLDRTATHILELDSRTHDISLTRGSYSDHLERERQKREAAKKAYTEQQDEIHRLETRAKELNDAAKTGTQWEGSDNDTLLRGFKRNRAIRSAKRAKAIEKRAQRLDQLEKPFEKKPLELLLPKQSHGGNADIDLESAVAGYPNSFTLQPASLHIAFGTRLCLIGLNGAGKTTLVKTVTGVSPPLQGIVRIGSGLRFGHLMQEHESLDPSKTLLQTLREKSDLEVEDCFFLLDVFGLDPERANDHVETLSPGGRVRLILATFSAQRINALVLDEPTNHLDLEALAALEEALEGFGGTVILISHDRAFIERIRLDAVYVLDERGSLRLIPDYLAYIGELETNATSLLHGLKYLR